MKICNNSFFNFAIPFYLTSERFNSRVLPVSGELIFVRYYDRIPGSRFSSFRLFGCYGLCIASKSSGISSHFTIRNSFKRNSIEIRFFLYSPLLARIVSYDAKRRRYIKAKLYYLRIKKIAKSRFRFEKFKRIRYG